MMTVPDKQHGHADICRFILKAAPPDIVHKKDHQGWTCLMLAADFGHLPIVRDILAPINGKTCISDSMAAARVPRRKDVNAALHIARQKGMQDIVELLVGFRAHIR